MARGRMISKSLSTSTKYAALYAHPLGEFCQALYPLLVAHADDFGRLEGNLFTVKHSVVPASPRPEIEIREALTLLHNVHLVIWYEVGGAAFLQIVDFERHQSGLHKRTSSRFPRVPGKSGKFQGVPLQLNRTELKGTEGKGTRAVRRSALATLPADDGNLAVIGRLAHLAIDVLGVSSYSDLIADLKQRCAEARIDYSDPDVVRKALDAALAQKKAAQAS